jgi:predicted membrane protein
MGIMFSGAFWGILLILIGLSVLIRVFFNIDVPVVRIVFGGLIIFVGISILTGKPFQFSNTGNVMFGEGKYDASSGKNEYNVIFGKGVMDLRGMNLQQGKNKIESNTVFGETQILVSKNQAFLIKASTAFGAINLPDGETVAFGSNQVKSASFQESAPYLQIEVNAVFGATRITLSD